VITLRELARDDIARINAWRADRRVVDGLAAPFRYIDPEVDQAWYDRYLASRGREVRCAICHANGEAIGVVSLTGIDPVHRHAEMHLFIGPGEARNRGAGTAATLAMLTHAFDDLNLHRVWLTVVASNVAARRVYEKTGFRVEGTIRDGVFKDGRFHDQLLMGLLAEEFRSRKDSRT
jgi:RimJ/RimL family protein N-acetyltransferase